MSKVVKGTYTQEAVAGFTHRTAMEEAARCLLCHDAPCSKGCPAGTDPGKFIRSIRFRNPKGAAETIRENNIMGASCAQICPYDRLCEEECSRCGIDRPIEIGKLQRYAMEQEEIFGLKTLVAPADKKAQKVACVGAGPASLACAAELAKAGYKVTVFEREAKAGGVLTYGIVPSRLQKKFVDQDVAKVTDLGVEIICNKEAKDADLEAFDAVFFGMGLWDAKIPNLPGKDLKGVYGAAEFLKEANVKLEGFNPGKKVVVVGGGDVAVDCAVTAKLLGAEDVKIVYRRTLEEAPGNMTEFQYALSLGIGVTTNMSPLAVVGESNVTGMSFKGRDGVCESAKLELEADTVVFAIGQGAEDFSGFAKVALDDKGGIVAEAGKTDKANYFAAGDVVNGGKTAVEAVAEGKVAAAAIVEFLEKGVK